MGFSANQCNQWYRVQYLYLFVFIGCNQDNQCNQCKSVQTLAHLYTMSNRQSLITYSHDHQHVSLGLVLLQPARHSLQQLLYAATLLAAGEQRLQLLLF